MCMLVPSPTTSTSCSWRTAVKMVDDKNKGMAKLTALCLSAFCQSDANDVRTGLRACLPACLRICLSEDKRTHRCLYLSACVSDLQEPIIAALLQPVSFVLTMALGHKAQVKFVSDVPNFDALYGDELAELGQEAVDAAKFKM
jgi:hypothetical protein